MSILKRVNQIIDDLQDDDRPLTGSLLKVRVIADEIDDPALIEWVQNELEGYSNKQNLPDYRKQPAIITGTLTNGYHTKHNDPIPLSFLEEELRDYIKYWRFCEPVSTIEQMANQKKGVVLNNIWVPEVISHFNFEYQKANPNLRYSFIESVFDCNNINNVLSPIRNKLLNFMLQIRRELKKQNPEDESLATAEIKTFSHQLLHSMNISGTGHTITVGDNNQVSVNNKIKVGDITSLREELSKHKVPQTDIRELEAILAEEQPVQGRFGPKVSEWIGKMVGKAASGGWQIGIGAAGNILASTIAGFLGIPIPIG